MKTIARTLQVRARKPIVLLVETLFLLRWKTASSLRDISYDVVEAADANEAATTLDAGIPVDVAFVDVQVTADYDGYGLIAWMAKHLPSIPVVITSGELAASDFGPSSPLRAFIAKPYALFDLNRHLTAFAAIDKTGLKQAYVHPARQLRLNR